MQEKYAHVALCVLAMLTVLAACSSSPGGLVGEPCSTNQDCAPLTQGNAIGVCVKGACTRSCVTDQDCGCAPSTGPGNGSCPVACISFTISNTVIGECERACANSGDCHGSTSCQSVPQFTNGASVTDGSQTNFSACW